MDVKRAIVLAIIFATGCATPQEVKQATVALDDGYRNNLELMQKYRDTLESFNQLHHTWARYIHRRLLLSLAVDWATVDPGPNVPDAVMKATRDELGDEVLAWINRNRLIGLPARGPLASGSAKLDALVQGLPALTNLVRERVDSQIASQKDFQSSVAFDEYARRMGVLRNANAAVRGYLGVDVTVSKDDVKDIADSIKKLRSGT